MSKKWNDPGNPNSPLNPMNPQNPNSPLNPMNPFGLQRQLRDRRQESQKNSASQEDASSQPAGDSTQTNSASPTDSIQANAASAVPVSEQDSKGVLVGVVRSFNERSSRKVMIPFVDGSEIAVEVWSFLLDRYDEGGNRLPPVAVGQAMLRPSIISACATPIRPR